MEDTVNLGVLFREKIKGQPIQPSRRGLQKREKSTKILKEYNGIRGISRVESNKYAQGYFFQYRYTDNGKQRTMQSKSMYALYERIIDKGDDFIIDDKIFADRFLKKYCTKEEYNILYEKYIQE